MNLGKLHWIIVTILIFISLNGCKSNNELIDPSQYLNNEAIDELGNEHLKTDGNELANLFLKDLIKDGPVDIENFDKAAIEIYQKELPVIENIMNGKVSLLNGYGIQEVGYPINWFHSPKGDLQWPTHLSRHYWLNPLAHAWRATKDPKYSGKIVEVLIDWIERNPVGSEELTWGTEGDTVNCTNTVKEGFFPSYVDGPWTSLSAHARVDYWSYLLAMIYDSPQLTNKNLSIIFNSLANDHLKLMLTYPRKMNQFMSIATSLSSLSWYYPFLQGAKEAGEEGLKRVQFFANTEIYPDGSMAECSPNYSKGSLERVFKVMKADKQHGGTLYKTLEPRICNALSYLFFTADPSGNSPRIAKGKGSVFPLVEKIELGCNNSEIQYLNSKGTKGNKPDFLSVSYNWAGHVVFRSDWSSDATWLFFEPGPRGSGHSDIATLNIQLQSKGKWLLTDPGYYTYSNSGKEGLMAKYLHSSAAHNISLVDKKDQIPFEPGKSRAFNTAPLDYHWSDNGAVAKAEGTYTFGFGENGEIAVTHKREITYLRNKDVFVIKDIFTGEGNHEIDLHWQLDPDVTFNRSNQGFIAQNGEANAEFEINCKYPVTIKSVKGNEEPLLGWFSKNYGELVPSTTVVVSSKGELPIVLATEIKLK